MLDQRNVRPILIGTDEDMDAINIITRMCPNAMNLVGKTSIFEIASLGRNAKFCIGNDTGPMHIIALTKCPTTAIFSTASFPEKAAPKGKHIRLLIRERLEDLSLDEVVSSIDLV